MEKDFLVFLKKFKEFSIFCTNLINMSTVFKIYERSNILMAKCKFTAKTDTGFILLSTVRRSTVTAAPGKRQTPKKRSSTGS